MVCLRRSQCVACTDGACAHACRDVLIWMVNNISGSEPFDKGDFTGERGAGGAVSRHMQCTPPSWRLVACIMQPRISCVHSRRSACSLRTLLAAAHTSVEYSFAEPGKGEHRYVLLLFKQPSLQQIQPPTTRAYFQTKQWAAEHGWGKPVAGVYFKVREVRSGEAMGAAAGC